MKRKHFTTKFKAKVALEAIKGQRTVNEIASTYSVHPTQVNSWKKQLLEGASDVFNGKKQQRQELDAEAERDRLYRQIGMLQVEVDWMKKKTGFLD